MFPLIKVDKLQILISFEELAYYMLIIFWDLFSGIGLSWRSRIGPTHYREA